MSCHDMCMCILYIHYIHTLTYLRMHSCTYIHMNVCTCIHDDRRYMSYVHVCVYVQYFFDVQFRSSKKLEKLTFCCPFLIIASHNSSIAWFCTKSAMSCSWLCGISILRYGSDTFCWVDILCEDILKLHITLSLVFWTFDFPIFCWHTQTPRRALSAHTTPP